MSKVMEQLNKIMESPKIPTKDFHQWETAFKETTYLMYDLCESTNQEIEEMLREMDKQFEKYFATPDWLRIIGFRILVTSRPDDEELKNWAMSSLMRSCGPKWVELIKGW